MGINRYDRTEDLRFNEKGHSSFDQDSALLARMLAPKGR